MKKDNELVKRIGISCVIILLLDLILYYSHIFYMKVFIIILTVSIALAAISELKVLIQKSRGIVSDYLLYIFTSLLICTVYGQVLGIIPFLSVLFTFFAAILCISIFYFSHVNHAMYGIGVSFFSICYIGIPLGLLLSILYSPMYDGKLFLLYLVVVTKVTDIAAYFVGKFFGKKKLAPLISPNKTYEGLLGGVIIAAIVSFCFAKTDVFSVRYPILTSIILGILIASIGQIGDLTESLLKRNANTKDSSRIPGLGGVLDILDSLLFTTPLFIVYLHWMI